jgi:hypothetical protein
LWHDDVDDGKEARKKSKPEGNVETKIDFFSNFSFFELNIPLFKAHSIQRKL